MINENKIKILELFSGYSSQFMALKRLGIDCLHDISEIDQYAIKANELMNGECYNWGDITKISEDFLPQYDLITYSSPCQDFSTAGKQAGGEKGSGTRSSLLWECERIIRKNKPKYLLMENVKGLVSKKFKPSFDKWLETLEEIGYKNYWQVLNAKDFGVPQNRERIFVVSIRNDIEQSYTFPEKKQLDIKLKDILEPLVDKKYYLSQEKVDRFLKQGNVNPSGRGMNGNVNTKDISDTLTTNKGEGPKILQLGNIINTGNFDNPQRGRIYSSEGVSPALNTCGGGGLEPKIVIGSTQKNAFIGDGFESPTLTSAMGQGGGHVPMVGYSDTHIRKLTTRECFRLMGVSNADFDKLISYTNEGEKYPSIDTLPDGRKIYYKISKSQLYKMAGNSIVVDVLVEIFRNLFIKISEKSEEKGQLNLL